jgi:hypothetical protein
MKSAEDTIALHPDEQNLAQREGFSNLLANDYQ